MEVNPNAGAGPAQRVVSKPAAAAVAKSAQADSASFREAEAIRTVLQQTPDVRPDAVQRGRALTDGELTGGMQYPPLSTIRAIAHLVAGKLSQDNSQS